MTSPSVSFGYYGGSFPGVRVQWWFGCARHEIRMERALWWHMPCSRVQQRRQSKLPDRPLDWAMPAAQAMPDKDCANASRCLFQANGTPYCAGRYFFFRFVFSTSSASR